jgi:hypothetical protein
MSMSRETHPTDSPPDPSVDAASVWLSTSGLGRRRNREERRDIGEALVSTWVGQFLGTIRVVVLAHEHFGVDPAICSICSEDPDRVVWISDSNKATRYHRVQDCDALAAGQASQRNPAPVIQVMRGSDRASWRTPCQWCWRTPDPDAPDDIPF